MWRWKMFVYVMNYSNWTSLFICVPMYVLHSLHEFHSHSIPFTNLKLSFCCITHYAQWCKITKIIFENLVNAPFEYVFPILLPLFGYRQFNHYKEIIETHIKRRSQHELKLSWNCLSFHTVLYQFRGLRQHWHSFPVCCKLLNAVNFQLSSTHASGILVQLAKIWKK
jgi:hypothetical protein